MQTIPTMGRSKILVGPPVIDAAVNLTIEDRWGSQVTVTLSGDQAEQLEQAIQRQRTHGKGE